MVVISPLVAAAGINAGSGLLSGLFGGGLQRSVEQANLNAQAFNLKTSILEARDAGKANLGLNIFSQVFGETGKDLDLGRQAAAQRLQFGEFMPKQLGLGREEARWQAAFENSADMKEKSRRERLGRLQESIANLRATPTGMFGRIAQAPIESLMV